MFVVAHISDLHFNGTRFNRARIESTLSYLNARADGIDALLVTGDIADEARHASTSRPTASWTHRCDAGHRRQPRPARELQRGTRQRAQHGTGQLLVAGRRRAAAVGGQFHPRSQRWLPRRRDPHVDVGADRRRRRRHPRPGGLSPSPRHHRHDFMDTIRQTGEERLAELVATHPNIVGFVCGHAHSACVTRFATGPWPSPRASPPR